MFVLWKYSLLSNSVTLANNSSSFPTKLAPRKLTTALRTELQSREDHLRNLKMKYFLLPTHLAFLYSFALSKPVQVCPCSQMFRIYIAAAELLYCKISYKLLLLWFYTIVVFCHGDTHVLKHMLFYFQIATRNNGLGEFDCNYYINYCRFWWGCFSIPHSHYLVYFSLENIFQHQWKTIHRIQVCFKVTFSVIIYVVVIKKLRRLMEQLLHGIFFSLCSLSKSEYFSLWFLSYVI